MTVARQEDLSEVFRRIERTSLFVAGHPDYPGKPEALGRCREDVQERFEEGMLTVEQLTRLMTILGDDGMAEPQDA
jgi:hypothetical protein